MEKKEKNIKQRCLLVVLDGLGIRAEKLGNAVLEAKTPNLDALWSQFPHCLLGASGHDVGLSADDPGNSEVCHINMGAGSVVPQSLPMINEAIRDGSFRKNPVLLKTLEEVKKRKTHLHLMGILSPAGVHGHIDHLFEILSVCREYKINPFIHVFLDGRDTGLREGYIYMNVLEAKMQELRVGRIASISGHRFAMDRDNRWDRTQEAYMAMVGKAKRIAEDPLETIQLAYDNGENDQVFEPTMVVNGRGQPVGKIEDNDVVIHYNFREDRAREITKALVQEKFPYFDRDPWPKNLYFVSLQGYKDDLPIQVMFKPIEVKTTLASVISAAGLKQFNLAETEKYAHVTYFFDGGRERPYPGQEFLHIPSPKVIDYSETPEMSAGEITKVLIERIKQNHIDFILVNFANPDMLGHTGNMPAIIKGLEFVDNCVKQVVSTALDNGMFCIVTADHGNCEQKIDESTGGILTSHTKNPVPLILCSPSKQLNWNKDGEKLGTGTGAVVRGRLSDVAPTILSLLGLKQPVEMTGRNLIEILN